MSNDKQSSVEWLSEIIRFANKELYAEMFEAIEQAKAMHKKEIEDACKSSIASCGMGHIFIELPEQYYEQTYGGGEQ
jgi:hypothetical protein